MANRHAVDIEFEFKRHKNKSKLRENELLEALNDKEKEITKLEKSLNAVSAERLQDSKELLQKSFNVGGKTDSICIKCEDLQRLLEENKKNTLEFEKLTLEYDKLKLNYAAIEKENETNKRKIIRLEELQEKEKDKCEKLLLDVQQLREKLQTVQRDYEVLTIQNSSKHEECMALNGQIEVAREKMVELEEKFTKLELSWQEQQQTINDIEAKYAAIQWKYEQLQCQYEQLEATRGQSLIDYQRLEKENIDLQTEIEDLKNKVHDAQQNLLESNAKCEETAKKTKTAKEEYSTKTSKVQQENEQLKQQLLEIQTQFEDLQKECDDLSNQLMDNLQDNEHLKNENTKLKNKLEDHKEKKQEINKAEAEINELKSQLEKVLSDERINLLKTPPPCRNSSMRSSGVCVEEEETGIDSPQSQDLLRKFCELSESLTEIELEHSKGKTRVFKSAFKNPASNIYKMYLKNILGVHKIQKEFDMEIANIHLQGSFKQHSFHIVELSGEDDKPCEIECKKLDTNGFENATEHIEKLQQEIIQLKTSKEQERLRNKSLVESTERALSEMRVQITQLSAELLEKSTFVENCACHTYKQQIEHLEKENADITILCEELQEKNCTFNNSYNGVLNNTAESVEVKTVVNNNLKELERLKRRELELLETYDSQTKTLEELEQRCFNMETDLETARAQLKNQEKEFGEKLHQLQLENLQKLDLSVNQYRENMKKYNKDWEQRRDEYEFTIKCLQNQLDAPKHAAINAECLKMEEKGNISVSQETEIEGQTLDDAPKTPAVAEHQDNVLSEDIEAIKQDKCRLEEDKLSLQQQLSTYEETLKHLKEENHSQYEELALLNAKLVSLEEQLEDAKVLHVTLSRENSSLKTEIDVIKEDLNCIPELHDKNQQLSCEMEKLNSDYSQLQDKLQEAEIQIQEFCKEDGRREELIRTLQTKLTQLTVLEEEKKSLANDFENLKLESTQLRDKLHKAEVQIQEFCSEDASREELIQTLQTKLCNMTAMEEEKKNFEIESMHLRETLNSFQEKETETSKEIENLRQTVETLTENVSELVNSKAKLHLEKTDIEEKLRLTTSEYNLLQTDKVLLDTQLNKLTEEGKSLYEKCSALQEEKTTLAEELNCLKGKEKAGELLQQIISEKAELEQKLRLATVKLETVQNQMEEKENNMSQVIEEKLQIQLKTIEEKHKQLENIEREKETTKQDNTKLYQDLLELKQSYTKAIEENQEQKQKTEQCKKELTKLEQEKQEQQLTLETVKQDQKNLQQDLTTLKESLSKDIEEKQQELNHLENNYQKAQQHNHKLEQKLHDLTADLINFKEYQQDNLKENAQLRNELLAKEDSLFKLKNDLQNLQDKLTHYNKLQEDKNKLEASLNILKKAQTGALSSLQEENEQLHKTIQQYEQQHEEFKEKEETLKQKIESLYQQLHEMRGKVHSYEQLLLEHKEVESVLTTTVAANQKLQEKIVQLSSEQENYVSKIENLSSEIEKLNSELGRHTDEKQILETKLSHLEEALQEEHLSVQKEHHELKNYLEELKLKCDSLQVTNNQLDTLNHQMGQQLNSAKEKLGQYNSVQEELEMLKVQYTELQHNLKKTVDEAGRCSLVLREEVERHKQLLQKQLDNYNSLKIETETKQHSLSEENRKLSDNFATLQKEKLLMEEKLREITVRNFEYDLQRQAIDVTANTSTDSNTSHSPRGRKSLDRINDKLSSISLEEKLINQKNSATAERKNRRLSTHDERRRQSYWGAAHDKETMTDPLDINCSCEELDRKLKECERNLFIKNSHVTALTMELKNHPLKEENAGLKKRLQEEQDKHRIEIKRYKNKLYEQTTKAENAIAAAAHATAKSAHAAANAALAGEQKEASVLPKVVADVEIQTDNDLSISIQKLQAKYNDLTNICRSRYNMIKELEEKIAQKENSDVNSLSALETAPFKLLNNQCDSLKKELDTVKKKYEFAKKVLYSRRAEVTKLRAQLEENK